MKIVLSESNWIVVRQCAENDGVAVLPLGSLEQHGPHLPLATDTFQVNEIIKRAMAWLPDSAHICLLPVLPYTVVQWASPLASVGISPETHTRVLVEICASLHEIGFRKMIFVHGHGGLTTGRTALWQAMFEKRPALYVDYEPYAAYAVVSAKMADEKYPRMDGHAGAGETSMMLALRPDLVHHQGMKQGAPDLYGRRFPFPPLKGPGVYAIPSIEAMPEGYLGDPRRASVTMGNRLLDRLARCTAGVLAELAAKPTPREYTRVWRKKNLRSATNNSKARRSRKAART